jgi:hypothetical protein
MTTIVTRITNPTGGTAKGSPLTSAEIDQNFINLNDNKLETSFTGNTNIVTLGTVTAGTWNASAVALAYGGTGATSASAARTNLGLAINTDVQAYNALLLGISGLSTTGLVSKTGVGSASAVTITAGTGISVSNGNGVSGNPTITNSGVTSINGLTGAVSYSAGAKGAGSDLIFWENDIQVTGDYTITLNKNAMTAGPVTINTGVTVTVQSGSTWTIV